MEYSSWKESGYIAINKKRSFRRKLIIRDFCDICGKIGTILGLVLAITSLLGLM